MITTVPYAILSSCSKRHQNDGFEPDPEPEIPNNGNGKFSDSEIDFLKQYGFFIIDEGTMKFAKKNNVIVVMANSLYFNVLIEKNYWLLKKSVLIKCNSFEDVKHLFINS